MRLMRTKRPNCRKRNGKGAALLAPAGGGRHRLFLNDQMPRKVKFTKLTKKK